MKHRPAKRCRSHICLPVACPGCSIAPAACLPEDCPLCGGARELQQCLRCSCWQEWTDECLAEVSAA